MGFQHGAQLQLQQQARDQIRRGSGVGVGTKAQMKSRIRDVWRGNLNQELRTLRDLVDRFPYISMVNIPFRSCSLHEFRASTNFSTDFA